MIAPGNWDQVLGVPVTPPMGQMFYLRTRGQVVSGPADGSAGLIESTVHFYLNGNEGTFGHGVEKL